MKTIKWFVLFAISVALFSNVVKGFTIDGTLEPGYGTALATQTLGTSFGDNSVGVMNYAEGSELDAAYGVISNSTLYLFLAGNLQGSSNTYNKIELFIDSIPGAGQNTLTNNPGSPDSGAVGRMSYNGDGLGDPGLTFDTGFAADYWIGVVCGGGSPGGATSDTLYINYFTLPTLGGGTGGYQGSENPTNDAALGMGIHAAINNINIAGVDGNGCTTNAASGAQQSASAIAVNTGIELSIPLSALGGTNITGAVKVCALLNGQGHDYLSNQALPPLAVDGTSNCVGSLTEPTLVNLSTLAGTPHYFVVPAVGCNYLVTPSTASFGPAGGSSNVAVTAGAGCSWTATNNNPEFITITSPTSGTGNGTVNYTVAADTVIDPRTGTLTVAGQTVTITQQGIQLPPLGSVFNVDGTVDGAYGCPLAIQQVNTGFGDSVNGALDAAIGGSELDGAYGMIQNNVLYLLLTGNLENNGNKLEVFLQTAPPAAGVNNTLTNLQPIVDGDATNNINRMAAGGGALSNGNPGLTFDVGFVPNYWIGVNGSGAPGAYTFFVNYAQLWPGGTNSSGLATNGYFVGSVVPTNYTLIVGNTGFNPYGIQATINNSNTNGVDGSGTGCGLTAGGATQSVLAASVPTGVELAIPLGALGNPTGTVEVCAFVNGQHHDFVSNQILGPMTPPDPADCLGLSSLGEPTTVDMSQLSLYGDIGQHFFTVGPEAKIMNVGIANATNVVVTYQTSANTNLSYQLQRVIGQYTTNSAAWSNRGGLVVGNGGSVTFTDLSAATNKPGVFYRVRQTPICP